jgi:hypothetical protein
LIRDGGQVGNGERDHQSRWIRFSTKEEDRQRASFRTLPGEDASFNQLYSLRKIELTKKLRKNHGRNESWQFLICLKMAGDSPCEKEPLGRQVCNHPADSYNVTTAKEFDLSAGESALTISGPVRIRGKFTAWAYHVNNFADLFLAIAGVMSQFSSRSRQIKKSDCQLTFGTSRAVV